MPRKLDAVIELIGKAVDGNLTSGDLDQLEMKIIMVEQDLSNVTRGIVSKDLGASPLPRYPFGEQAAANAGQALRLRSTFDLKCATAAKDWPSALHFAQQTKETMLSRT